MVRTSSAGCTNLLQSICLMWMRIFSREKMLVMQIASSVEYCSRGNLIYFWRMKQQRGGRARDQTRRDAMRKAMAMVMMSARNKVTRWMQIKIDGEMAFRFHLHWKRWPTINATIRCSYRWRIKWRKEIKKERESVCVMWERWWVDRAMPKWPVESNLRWNFTIQRRIWNGELAISSWQWQHAQRQKDHLKPKEDCPSTVFCYLCWGQSSSNWVQLEDTKYNTQTTKKGWTLLLHMKGRERASWPLIAELPARLSLMHFAYQRAYS